MTASRAYYVDSVRGDDGNSGATADAPWQTLDVLNAVTFKPGDRIWIKAGSRFTGQLRPQGSGAAGNPIRLQSYGEGGRPRIDGEGRVGAALLLHNVEYWEVSGLELTNQGEDPQPWRFGALVSLMDFGVAHEIGLTDLYVHDVNGSPAKANMGMSAGIFWHNQGESVPSYFDGLRIENCHLVRTDRDGIKGRSDFHVRYNWYPSLNVVIRGNLLEDIGGDGITPYGCEGALVEYNVIRGGRMRTDEHAVGIWPWSCDDTVIQYNEVSGYRGYKDGQGFDADFNCRNTLIQYNYSHDNEGGFVLICNSRGTMPRNIGNIGTVIRYNVSQNDGTPEQADGRGPIFAISGGVSNTRIYNNVIYVGGASEQEQLLLMVNVWGEPEIGYPDNVWFANNIFIVTGKAGFTLNKGTHLAFSNNVFDGEFINMPEDPSAFLGDPGLVAPGTGEDGFESLEGYMLAPHSPVLQAGFRVPESGGRDMMGQPLPESLPPSPGAFQAP